MKKSVLKVAVVTALLSSTALLEDGKMSI